jgi:hypothetical protein
MKSYLAFFVVKFGFKFLNVVFLKFKKNEMRNKSTWPNKKRKKERK